ncbi:MULTISPECIES: type II toxin-antitoxin system ParD family antitoxin [unclassified Pedobacter]|jgi:antitoxin ParD1/3/4|uniref:type II toxin-antitoxin system ParD family antitoxin n=1 Tax=unclassified Pedobacter TaxID=2628915 RepID=UPI001DCEAFC1|nr:MULTISPECIES: type II toxin-antitoxin system ParD family antitoxin [unclassified Pedobacter]MDQ0965835.1 antitoxin ParD1/3/4 [Flavobacterium sp. W4I14]CAH0143381.1 Antitoxin ParD1 [Pedobacter sp. Bi36]CAH0199221.1 Antitoxin ParD1 [Pedobacter sp. Bi126]
MGRNTSILLGDHFDNFISEKIASGKFSSASEVIRTSLRLLEEEEKQIELLREALKIGEESGFVKKFDPAKHLQELHRKHL